MDNIRILREKRGLTQKQLADLIGVAPSTVANYENDVRTPNIYALCDIADALDVSLDVLVRGKEKTLSKERAMQEAISRLDGLDSSALREVVAFAQYLVYRKEREQAEGQASADN